MGSHLGSDSHRIQPDLAERINMSKQATNSFSVSWKLSATSNVELKKAVRGHILFLTRRGWQSIDLQRAAVLELEAQWAKAIGQKRFEDVKESLAQLIALDTNRSDEPR